MLRHAVLALHTPSHHAEADGHALKRLYTPEPAKLSLRLGITRAAL